MPARSLRYLLTRGCSSSIEYKQETNRILLILLSDQHGSTLSLDYCSGEANTLSHPYISAG